MDPPSWPGAYGIEYGIASENMPHGNSEAGNRGKQQDHEYASNHAWPKPELVAWPSGIRVRIVTFLLASA
jgi:hypothetical protein